MIKQITIFALASLSLMACGGTTTNVNTNSNVNAANSAANAKPANTNTTANANTAKPANGEPKRISFSKGQDNSTETFELEPGQTKKFVVGAKKGQDVTIGTEEEGSQIKIAMLTAAKGKLVDVTAKPTAYNATTVADGDLVFEVSNPTKTKMKASVNVMIITIGDD